MTGICKVEACFVTPFLPIQLIKKNNSNKKKKYITTTTTGSAPCTNIKVPYEGNTLNVQSVLMQCSSSNKKRWQELIQNELNFWWNEQIGSPCVRFNKVFQVSSSVLLRNHNPTCRMLRAGNDMLVGNLPQSLSSSHTAVIQEQGQIYLIIRICSLCLSDWWATVLHLGYA